MTTLKLCEQAVSNPFGGSNYGSKFGAGVIGETRVCSCSCRSKTAPILNSGCVMHEFPPLLTMSTTQQLPSDSLAYNTKTGGGLWTGANEDVVHQIGIYWRWFEFFSPPCHIFVMFLATAISHRNQNPDQHLLKLMFPPGSLTTQYNYPGYYDLHYLSDAGSRIFGRISSWQL